jgi:hypothetical protein
MAGWVRSHPRRPAAVALRLRLPLSLAVTGPGHRPYARAAEATGEGASERTSKGSGPLRVLEGTAASASAWQRLHFVLLRPAGFDRPQWPSSRVRGSPSPVTGPRHRRYVVAAGATGQQARESTTQGLRPAPQLEGHRGLGGVLATAAARAAASSWGSIELGQHRVGAVSG